MATVRRVRIVTVMLIFLLCVAGEAAAAAPHGEILGVVARSDALAPQTQPRAAATSGLTYHGGRVMRTNRVYMVFWQPSGYPAPFSGSYTSLVDRYVRDVAADSGKRTNVYSSDTQYYDGTGRIAYATTYAGALFDTQPYPMSGCLNGAFPASPCLTDAQIRSELDRLLTANPGLPRGLSTVYMILTPPQVGVCTTSEGTNCSFKSPGFCAYHFFHGETPYAVQPYPDTGGCDMGQHPNGDVAADNQVSLISHEHNGAITDPYGDAWYDSAGLENGDICRFDFGAPLGATASGQFNQVINGNPYWTQEEWSNLDGGCVQRSAARPPSPSFSLSPNPVTAGRAVLFNATQSSDIDGNVIGFSWNFGDGNTGSGATPAHAYARAGTYTVTLTVNDDGGASATTNRRVTVTAAAISSLPTGTLTVGRSGKFKYSFRGAPPRARGRVSFATKNAIAAARRRKLNLGAAAFTLSAGGRATVTIKLSRANFVILKRRRSLKTRATVTIGAVTRSAVFTLKAPR